MTASPQARKPALPLRLLLPAALLVFTAALGFWRYSENVRLSDATLNKETLESLASEAGALGRTVEYLTSRNAPDLLRREMLERGKDPQTRAALLLDERGEIVAGPSLAAQGRPLAEQLKAMGLEQSVLPAAEVLRLAEQRGRGMQFRDAAADVMVAIHPVSLGGSPIIQAQGSAGPAGAVLLARALGQRRADLHADVARRTIRGVVPMVVFALLLFGASNFVIARRVSALVAASERFAGGDTKARSGLHGPDELAQIGAAFDSMAAQVERSKVELAESERRLRSIVEAEPECVKVVSPEGELISMNPAGLAMLEVATLEEARAQPLLDYIVAENREAFARLHEAAMHGQSGRMGFELVGRRGARRWLETHAVPLRDSGDVITAVLGITRDITERKRAEEALHATEQRLGTVLQTIEEVLWTAEPGQIGATYLSPAFTKVWGRPAAEMLLHPEQLLESVHPEDRDRFQQAIAEEARGMHVSVEYRIRRPDGELRWIWDQGFPVRNAAGEVVAVSGIAADITQRKRAEAEREKFEAQMHQAQKLQAIGTLAGGIAHDFNNILGAIIGNVELARLDLGKDHPARESIEEIARASQRAKRLVQQILAFNRQQSVEKRAVNLSPVLEEAGRLLRASIPAGIELTISPPGDAPDVLADPTQIHQVLVNLGTNAWHSLIPGKPGRIEIELAGVTFGATADLPHPELRHGRYARLTVKDNGQGMDEPTLQRIFEPFFTTKPPGQGTGLGLAVVHGIVKIHDGVIHVQSRPGLGTTVDVYLPTAPMPSCGEPAQGRSLDQVRGAGQSLVYLDDEAPLVTLAVRMFGRLGYRVSGFTRAADAIAAVRVDPAAFDLVVTDYNMPEMSGLDVAAELLRIRPDLPIALTTGYITDDLRQHAINAGIRQVLHKPDTVDELCQAVHHLLTSPAPRQA